MHPMLNIAIRAARAAGNIIIRQVDRVHEISADLKGMNDFVTEVDYAAEQIIISTIHKAYPGHAILAEESGSQGANDYQWIIDPLDGTTNFLHGFPQFAVSIALQYKNKLEVAVVYDPLKDELFTAVNGQGANLNDRKIRVSQHRHLDGALLGTGFPFREQGRLDEYIETFKALFTMTAGIRRAGAAALDLSYVACGRLDGFWEFGLKPWDLAAGVLIIQESGGIVGNLDGGEFRLTNGDIVTANPRLYKEIINLLIEKQAHNKLS